MVENDKIVYYLHIFYAFMIYLTFSCFSKVVICKLQGSFVSFLKLSQISKNFILIEENLHINGHKQFKLMLFKV